MAVIYAVADGPDVADNLLTALSPQPNSTGVQVTSRDYAADGTVSEQSSYIELRWRTLSLASFQALMTAFGLSATVLTNEVTVRIPNAIGTEARMNGIAVRPEIGRDSERRDSAYRNTVILVKHLEAAS